MSASNLCIMATEDESCVTDSQTDISQIEMGERLSDQYELEGEIEAMAVPPDDFSFGFFPPADPMVLPDFTNLDPETQERLQALLQAAGITKAAHEGKSMFADPDMLRRLSTSVSSALDEAADALTRMKAQGPAGKEIPSSGVKMAPTCDRLEDDPSATAAGVVYGFGQTPGTPVSVEEGESLLSLACSAGYYELAQVLLAMRTNIEDRGSKGDCTPLMEAGSAGHLDIVKLLIAHGADVNAQSSTGCTPLMYACAGGHEHVVNALLEADADVEIRNENGHCPLMEAASAGHVAIARSLVNHDASVQSVGNGEFKVGLESPLTLASYKGHIEMVKFLLKAGPKASKRLEELHTALMEASMDGHLEVARLLLDFGAPVNLASDSFESPLTLAACGGHVDLVRLLLDRGAQIEDPNDEGYTPLMEAAREGHEEVVELLLDRGAEINAQTEETGETALTLAACGGFREVVEVLVRRGADLDLGANTPLMEAAQEGHLDTVKFLIQATLAQGDLSIDAATATGDTALTYAAENGHADVSAALLDAGSQIDHEADGGRTALMKAAKAGHYCTVQFLINKGAQVNKASLANDHTALSLACANGHGDVVQLLLQSGANPNYKLKDSSTCIIESAKGGFTNVVQMLLDWPGIKLPKFTSAPPSLQQLAAAGTTTSCSNQTHNKQPPPSCAMETQPTVQQATTHQQSHKPVKPQPTYQQRANNETANNEREATPPSAFNMTLDPQFLASVQKHQQQQQQLLQTPRTPQEWAELFTGNDPSISSDWLMMQAQKALLKQAHGQLNKSEFEQFTQLLKSTQMRFPPPTSLPSDSTATATPQPASDPPTAGQGIKRKATGGNLETAMKDLKKLQEAGTKTVTQQGTQTPTTALPPSCAKTKTQTGQTSQQPPGVHSKVSTVEMPDGSVVRADGTMMKPDGSIVRAPAHGFNFQLPPPPPPVGQPKVIQQPAAKTSGGHPQKVNAATQVGTPTVGSKTGQPANQQSAHQPTATPSVDLNTQTESNHDTALTLACAGGHEDLVSLLLQRGANLEHKDKKGFTPLILAATAGYTSVVEALLGSSANIEAQSERTKDTALSLACSSGRKEVVELLLKRGSNKEHRNVSDYTPLSLAASGGYVDIVQLLLNAGAEINSRTGSKLGISPLMLAAMNGHTAAVKLLLERGSDINAQIETNRNTALTLACFQGRHEVVKLLLDYKANVEHRAKTGLTPLMEAASGGYVEVGKVLLIYAADPNAAPVPSSRDTALTIAADKGHHKFVDLLLHHGAQIDSRNKKGCTSLWLACHTGHLETVQTLVKHQADVDAQDNRRVTPLMAAFRKGHVKVVKWLVRHVQQFPSDQECSRFIATIADKDQLIKCRQCMEVTVAAKDRQAHEANKAAETLLEEIAKEQEQANNRKMAKQRQKEKKKAKRQAKKAAQQPTDENSKKEEEEEEEQDDSSRKQPSPPGGDTRDSSISTPSPPPPPVAEEAPMEQEESDNENEEEDERASPPSSANQKKTTGSRSDQSPPKVQQISRVPMPHDEPVLPSEPPKKKLEELPRNVGRRDRYVNRRVRNTPTVIVNQQYQEKTLEKSRTIGTTRNNQESPPEEWKASVSRRRTIARSKDPIVTRATNQNGHPDDPYTVGWREVRRRANKLVVSSQAIARVIGRGGQNINAIREATGAHIEVEKQQPKKEQQDRLITIRGTPDASRQAVLMINGLIKDSESPVQDIIKKVREKDESTLRSYSLPDSGNNDVNVALVSHPSVVSNANSKNANAPSFPEVTLWNSQFNTTAKKQLAATEPVYTVAATESDNTQTTTVTSAPPSVTPSAEYSPFATPNVWTQRAAMRQIQQKHTLPDGGRKMDFASVAAARVSTSANTSPPPHQTVMEQSDQCKAPGFMRPARPGQSPVTELSAPPISRSFSPPAALGQSKSAFTSPAPAHSGGQNHVSVKYNAVGLPQYERPASATPTLGLTVDPNVFPYHVGPSSMSPPVSACVSLHQNSTTVTQSQTNPVASTGFTNALDEPDWLRPKMVNWPEAKQQTNDENVGTVMGIGSLSANLAQLQIQNDKPPEPKPTGLVWSHLTVNGPGSDWSNEQSRYAPKPPNRPEQPPESNASVNDEWFRQLAEMIQNANAQPPPPQAQVGHPQQQQQQPAPYQFGQPPFTNHQQFRPQPPPLQQQNTYDMGPPMNEVPFPFANQAFAQNNPTFPPPPPPFIPPMGGNLWANGGGDYQPMFGQNGGNYANSKMMNGAPPSGQQSQNMMPQTWSANWM